MTELSAKTAEPADVFGTAELAGLADAPPLAPAANVAGRVLDRAHLARMTAGDRDLEREVLELFSMQCEVLLGRMRDAPSAVVAVLAHTLNGSARGVGAWAVVEAAQAVERRAVEGCDVTDDLKRLSAAAAQTCVAVAAMTRQQR